MPSIRLRLIVALCVPVALVVLAAGLFAERNLRVRERARVEASVLQRAELVRELLGPASLEERDPEALWREVRRAAGAAQARVTLIGADGTVVADSEVAPDELARVENHGDRPEVRAALAGQTGASTRRSRTVGRPLLYLGVPLEPGAGRGVVRLAVDLASVEARVAELRRELLAAAALALAVAVVLGFALASLVLRRVRELRGVVASLAAGDLERRVPWRSRDELGEIAGAINEMAAQLRWRLDAVTAEKEQLQAVLSGMVEGVLVVDREARVVLANPRLRELFGVWGDVVGRPHWEVIRRPEVETALRRAAEDKEAVVAELTLDELDGRVVQMHAIRFPASGELLGTVAVFHDVTELRRLEAVRREFVANVSHELKTPLTAIRGFAETLLGNSVSEEQRAQYLQVIVRHAERLARLIEDVLELSRIESRKLVLAPEALDLDRLANAVLRDLGPQLASRQLHAQVVSAGTPSAWADRRAVEQILANLLDNAAKYTDPGGRIEVRLIGRPHEVRVEVEDTGIGIPAADLPRLFERFYRVDKARSRDLGGTGLGLSIVKHLVQSLGGEVYVDSEPGRGTTFAFTLPRPPH